ncbi:MAG: TMEM165/GDT1 family protein [Synechococcaceae cyanobacterium]|jgi:putative Ca2+/H+ antiporter (TMEM165/GDT1 family)
MSTTLALLASTFVTVFLAELGDKTQLAIVSISGTSSRPGAVFAGSAAALVLASLVGAAAGGSLSSLIPTNALELAAAGGFLIIGTRLILASRGPAASEGAPETANQDSGTATP